MTGRAEGDGGYGGLPDEWHDYGDRESEAWRDVEWLVGGASVGRGSGKTPSDDGDDYVRETDVMYFRDQERVRVTRDVGGILFTRVPNGTRGRVVGTRSSVLGGVYATVAFDNGYTEEVRASDLERVGFFD